MVDEAGYGELVRYGGLVRCGELIRWAVLGFKRCDESRLSLANSVTEGAKARPCCHWGGVLCPGTTDVEPPKAICGGGCLGETMPLWTMGTGTVGTTDVELP